MPMRDINRIVIHCSATPPGADIGAASIDAYHRTLGWAGIGYHFVIRRNGVLEPGREFDRIGAHVAGHNTGSVGICLIGGIDDRGKSENNFTVFQMTTLLHVVATLHHIYPGAEILGHRDFPGVAKDCPCFDVREWWAEVGLP